MSGPLEIQVGRWSTLTGEPGGNVRLVTRKCEIEIERADVQQLAEALLAFTLPPATPSPQPTQCRTCRADIFWAVTPAGRRMPVNAQPDPAGLLVLSLPKSGELQLDTWRADEPSHAPPRRRWTSHFATCAQAGQHRRKP